MEIRELTEAELFEVAGGCCAPPPPPKCAPPPPPPPSCGGGGLDIVVGIAVGIGISL